MNPVGQIARKTVPSLRRNAIPFSHEGPAASGNSHRPISMLLQKIFGVFLHWFGANPISQVQVFLYFSAFITVLVLFLWLIINLAEGMLRVAYGFRNDF